MSSTQVRVCGYVVGYSVTNGEVLWTVKVKEEKSIHHGKKFLVHSCRVGTMLSRPAVDVTFRVAPIQVGEECLLKAVDVALASQPLKEDMARSVKPSQDTINLVVMADNDGLTAYFVGYENAEQARQGFADEGEELVTFLQIPLDDAELDDDLRGGLDAIASLSCMDGTRDAMEHILHKLLAKLDIRK